MIITLTRARRTVITVRTGLQTVSLSAPALGITHIGAAAGIATDVGSLAAAGAMAVKDIAAATVTGGAMLAVATETDMPAAATEMATRTAATAADMPAAMLMPEIATMAGADTVGAVNLTVGADMVADAGNPLE